jgi:hypothetical protein
MRTVSFLEKIIAYLEEVLAGLKKKRQAKFLQKELKRCKLKK